MKDTYRDILLSVAEDVLEMAGLLVKFDTPGGNSNAGMLIHSLIAMARESMPVVGWARQAMSAGVLPLAACDASFSHPYGQLGGFGCVQGVCDGTAPKTMCSSQSPWKWPGGEPVAWLDPTYACNGDGKRIQADLDASYERDLAQLAAYTGTPLRRLRSYMDGRILTPRQARRVGLIDATAFEDAAMGRLVTLLKEREIKS
jgi:ClpP class serine protease